ncbi:hypothetical protein ILYODFUR_034194 [Ilyodon furcidens]|uniref:Uncharacterized protein n=1 Tax=Ilyodon furcidens TaxID=33524 RepID=A0ABV0V957_9TELE
MMQTPNHTNTKRQMQQRLLQRKNAANSKNNIKLKLQAALKALAPQHNSASAATAGAWDRQLRMTDEAAIKFHTSPLGGTVSDMSYDLRSCRVVIWREAIKMGEIRPSRWKLH